MEDNLSRRDFLKLGAAAGTVAGLAQTVLGQESSKTLRIGFIGVGGRGTHLLRLVSRYEGVEIPAICDINGAHLKRAIEIVQEAKGAEADGYSKGPTDYRRMLTRDDLDAVVIATPMQLHAVMAVDSLRAGKHVLSEVAAAVTLDECWALVRAAQESGKTYMLSENCCYYRSNMMILNMVKKGVFGELTYAECGYVHDCRPLKFKGDGTLTWRGELARDYMGNLYPTHSLGPVAQWLGINRGDRLVSLAAFTSKQTGIPRYAAKRFGKDSPPTRIKFSVGDTTTTLIRTAKGAVIDLRYDTCSARPHPSTTYYSLQGTTASYEDRLGNRIWIEGKSKKLAWGSLWDYAKEYEHPKWKQWGEAAKKAGHGGADYFVTREFIETLREGRPSPIDAYDAAAWSSIIPLSAASIRAGGAPQEIPDFTEGAWERRKA